MPYYLLIKKLRTSFFPNQFSTLDCNTFFTFVLFYSVFCVFIPVLTSFPWHLFPLEATFSMTPVFGRVFCLQSTEMNGLVCARAREL